MATTTTELCGCIASHDHGFLPCAACRAEVNMDLMDVYGDERDEYDADWLRREEAASKRIAAERSAADAEEADAF